MTKGDTLPPPSAQKIGDPSNPGGDDSEDEAAGLTGSLGESSSPLAPPTGESGDGAPGIDHEASGDDLDGHDSDLDLGTAGDLSADVEVDARSDGWRGRLSGLAQKMGDLGRTVKVGVYGLPMKALELPGKAMETVSGHKFAAAGLGVLAVGTVLHLKYGVPIPGTKGGGTELADKVPAGGGQGPPRTGGLATELISSDRPSSGGSGSAVVDAAPQPSGSSSGAASEAASQAPAPRPSSPAVELIDSDGPVPPGGGNNAGEVLAQHNPVGVEVDGQGNYTIRIDSSWTPERPNVQVPGHEGLIFDQGTMDGRVARLLVENGADVNQVNANPSKVHQISMQLYAENNFGPDKQFSTGAQEPFIIRPGSRALDQMNQDFGVDISQPGSESTVVEPPASGGGGSGQAPAPETAPDGGGTTETPPDSTPGGGDVVPEDDNTGALLAAGAAGTLLGAGLVSTGVAHRSRRRARAAHGGGGGGGGTGDGHGGGGDHEGGGGGDTDPAAVAAIEAAFQARLAPLNDRLNQLRQLAQDRQDRIDELEQENDEEDEEWWERNGQIDVAGQLGGNIEDLNDPANTYRQNLVGEAVAAAMENPHSGVTNPGDLEVEGEQLIDQALGAGRPTGVVDVGGNPTDLDRRDQHLTALYNGVSMTEADGTTAIDSPDVVDTPNQLLVPVGPDGRILPGFLRAFSNVMREYRQYDHGPPKGPGNEQLLRMLGDTGEGLETKIPWRNWFVGMGARFVRGEETT